MLCRPGAFEAIRLLNTYISAIPSCVLWFGIMQGLIPKNDTLTSGEGLGWRIARDINLPEALSDRPRCDISLRELEIYARSNNSMKSIKTETKTRLLIELVPGVTSSFKTIDKSRANHDHEGEVSKYLQGHLSYENKSTSLDRYPPSFAEFEEAFRKNVEEKLAVALPRLIKDILSGDVTREDKKTKKKKTSSKFF